jgi:hypothetical protein
MVANAQQMCQKTALLIDGYGLALALGSSSSSLEESCIHKDQKERKDEQAYGKRKEYGGCARDCSN